jgi:hypothetical protein
MKFVYSGKWLWLLANDSRSKQFLKVLKSEKIYTSRRRYQANLHDLEGNRGIL